MAAGQGTITAKYQDKEGRKIFEIEEFKRAKFEIEGEKLIITNLGNIIYDRKIEITIGQTTGIKNPILNPGEKISYRLIAPEGTYTIRISDGISTPLIVQDVKLTGTGQVVGAIDESATAASGITGGIAPEEESEGELIQSIRDSKFIYIFILVIVAATILIAIERRYRKKISQ